MTEDTKKILLVADYGKNDLAFKEVAQRLYELAEEKGQKIRVDIVSVDPFNTAQTASLVAQAAEDGHYDVVYHNTAPRKDVKKARVDNDGEFLAYADFVTHSGKHVQIVGVNSGDAESVNTFSLLGDHVPEGVFRIKSDTHGSQFRSRDVFPPHVVAALTGEIQLEDHPFLPPEPRDWDKVRSASAEAGELLAGAYKVQLARHGDASKAYITVVSPASVVGAQLAIADSHFSEAEIDVLPLKSTREPWIEAAFAASQLAANSEQGEHRTLVALPDGATLNNAPHLFSAQLDNGAHFITSDLRTLAFIKDRVVEGSVADFGPPASERKITLDESGAPSIQGNSQPVSSRQIDEVAVLPDTLTPAYTDGYGNVKLAIPHRDLLPKLGIGSGEGQALLGAGDVGVTKVSVGGKEADALIASGSFAVHDGELALSRGSSGWPDTLGGAKDERNFAELFLRGGNASQAFNVPQPGDDISITLKEVKRGQAPGRVVDGDGLEATLPINEISKGA